MKHKLQETFKDFMKKQTSLKSKEAGAQNNIAAIDKNSTKNLEEEKEKATTDADKKDKIEEAKKESKNKAANRNQIEMIKRMIIENIIKYVLLISLLILFVIAIIKGTPDLIKILHDIFIKLLIGK